MSAASDIDPMRHRVSSRVRGRARDAAALSIGGGARLLVEEHLLQQVQDAAAPVVEAVSEALEPLGQGGSAKD